MKLLVLSKDDSNVNIDSILKNYFNDIVYLKTKRFNFGKAEYYSTNFNSTRLIENQIREELSKEKIDILFLEEFLSKDSKTLFQFDMDSTLIKEEVIDELARMSGIYEKVAEITKNAMQGNLDFNSSLKERVKLLKGIPNNTFEELYQRLTANDGVKEFTHEIKNFQSIRTIVSGGFIPIVEKFAKENSFQEFRANQLEIDDNDRFTGKVLGEIINKEKKRNLLIEFRDKYEITKSQTVAVGDGSNDSEMILEAGIGIGFHAKQGLKDVIRNWIDYHSMESLIALYYS
ncbi:MAG: phosphoserine phosphatase SerB [Leptospiraceae bacterium]|nr:phosphoserine phosphatase SerB [Leptospiraceae bacterium]